MEKDEEELRDFVYTGSRDGYFNYILLPKDYVNDGRSIEGRKTSYKGLKIGVGAPGAIYRMTTYNEGTGLIYNAKKKAIPIAIWRNMDEVDSWRATQQAVELSEKIKKDAGRDSLMNLLEPIRNSYCNGCRNRAEKAALLARVITYITS